MKEMCSGPKKTNKCGIPIPLPTPAIRGVGVGVGVWGLKLNRASNMKLNVILSLFFF